MDASEHLDVEQVPGTEIMRDQDGIHLERGHGGRGIILIPEPSLSRDDPLNWSIRWKASAMVAQSLFVFVSVMAALSLGPINGLLAADFGLDSTETAMLTGACVLALGYANFIIVPCSNIFGRRITSLVFSVMAVGFTIWEAKAQTHGSFLAARVMTGLATATNESIMVQVIADMFFVHQRGRAMGVYFTWYFLGLFIGPVLSGNFAAKYGWRNFFWLTVGMSAFNTLNLLVGFPETRYYREKREHRTVATAAPQVHDTDPKDTVGHVEELPTELVEHPPLGQGKPSRTQYAAWQKLDPNWRKTLVHDLISPWAKFLNPIIFWAGCMVAGPANLLLLWNLTQADLLAAPPYNFSTAVIGDANFAFVVGGLIGLFTAGPLSDYLAKRSTTKNGGIREAEFRLPALVPFTVLAIIGIVVAGVGYERKWPWEAILVVGFGITGLTVTSIPTIAIAYAVDCYTPISGDIMVVATVIKNTCGFSMSYWVPTMVESGGMIKPAMIEFALVIGPCLIGIAFYFFGKKLRRRTRNSLWHQ